MAKVFLTYLVLYGINSNLVLSSGAGVLEFQREKMYPTFRCLSALFLAIGIAICGLISYILYRYIYSVYDLFYINISVLVLIAGLYNLLVSFLWKKMSEFNNYLYESSFSYAFDLAFTVFAVMSLDMTVSFSSMVMQLAAVALVVVAMNIVVGFFVKGINRGYMNVNFRNLSVRLYLFAILSMILYYAGSLIVL